MQKLTGKQRLTFTRQRSACSATMRGEAEPLVKRYSLSRMKETLAELSDDDLETLAVRGALKG